MVAHAALNSRTPHSGSWQSPAPAPAARSHYLRTNAEVVKIVQYFAREKKPIAAVCHAAQLLAAADVMRGKRVSAYPACAAEVTLAGAEYAASTDALGRDCSARNFGIRRRIPAQQAH